LYKNMLDNIETPIVEVVEPIVEEVVEVVETEEAPAEEIVTETTEEAAEEVPAEEEIVEETTEEVKEVEVPVVIFDATDDDTVFAEKAEQVLAKYDLSDAPELKAYIDALQMKAQAVETPEIFTQIADYGDVEAVKEVLDEHHTLYSRREEEGSYRPNTDEFAKRIAAKDELTADYLRFDLNMLPSTKYPGINKFEEGIAEALAVEGETVAQVLSRYHNTMKQMKLGATAALTDVPAFIPAELYGAYNTLSKETREEMQYWDDDAYVAERTNKLGELRNIQEGIDARIEKQQRLVEAQQAKQQALVNDAINTETTFYTEMRKTMAEKLSAVQFSPDPKLNSLLKAQQVTTLTQAFSDGPDGEFARQALADAGVTFDYAKAQKLLEDVSKASQALAVEKHAVDAQGKPLNPVSLSKAQSAFKTVTGDWLKFADDILTQEKNVAVAGTAKAIETEVEKRKVLPKARPVAKAIGTAATNKNEPPAHLPYGSRELDEWYAKQTIREIEAQKASAYA
jgi:hypothetical protein